MTLAGPITAAAPTHPSPRARAASAGGSVTVDDEAPRETMADRAAEWRDRLVRSATFQRWAARLPIVRVVARRRARTVFDLVAGFAYTQTVVACVQSGLLSSVAEAPRTEAALAELLGISREGLTRLLTAAAALQLVERRSAGRWGLGAVGGPLHASPGLAELIAHNALLYDELRDPIALLRRPAGEGAALASYWPYVDDDARPRIGAAEVSAYSALMTATVAPLADEVLDAVSLGRCRHLLDVGGGEGRFALCAAARHPQLEVTVFDLPAVVTRAAQRVRAAQELGRDAAARVRVVGGDFQRDPLPAGADVATLVRVCLDHDDATVDALLRRVRAALRPGGLLVIAEPLAGVRGAEAVGDVYFAFYLRAMGRGRARRADEFRALLERAGFTRVRVRATRYPVVAGIITAEVRR